MSGGLGSSARERPSKGRQRGCTDSTGVSAEGSGASFRIKAYSGSTEGCYFVINLLFVHSYPSALLTQIGNHRRRAERTAWGAAGAGWAPAPRPGGPGSEVPSAISVSYVFRYHSEPPALPPWVPALQLPPAPYGGSSVA